tara:strand:+ start:54 stop:605 length:552 start_codon:yes stop_codon:yes gene_type:complete
MNAMLLKALQKAGAMGKYIKKNPAESAILGGVGAVGGLAGLKQHGFREEMRSSNELTKNQDLMDAQFGDFNDQMSEEEQINLMRDYASKHAPIWHKFMGGSTTDAFKKMKSGGLLNHYIDNDKGFKEFVEAQTDEEKINVVKKYRNNSEGWQYADTDEDILERFKTHGLNIQASDQGIPEGAM